MGALRLVATVLWVASSTFLAVGALYTIWRAVLARPPRLDPDQAPPVSIIKPLCGAEPGLLQNLQSFLELDYPEFEVLFLVASTNDPALDVVRELFCRHPRGPGRLVIGDHQPGLNPKVANLAPAWSKAKYDLVLCSDSNTRVSRDYLRELVPLLVDGRVGIVTTSVDCFGSDSFGACVEESVWNTFYLRWMNLARLFHYPFVLGKTMLFRRSVAARFGGMQSFADHCAEDFMMGHSMAQLGLMVEMGHRPVPQYMGKKSLRDFWSRSCRWHVLQKNCKPLVFALTPLQFPVVSALIGVAATGHWSTAIYTFTNWFAADAALLAITGAIPDIFAWFTAQLLSPLIWLHALFTNQMVWRGHRLRIGSRGWLRP